MKATVHAMQRSTFVLSAAYCSEPSFMRKVAVILTTWKSAEFAVRWNLFRIGTCSVFWLGHEIWGKSLHFGVGFYLRSGR